MAGPLQLETNGRSYTLTQLPSEHVQDAFHYYDIKWDVLIFIAGVFSLIRD